MLYTHLLKTSEIFEKFRSHPNISDEPSPQDKKENLMNVSSAGGIKFKRKHCQQISEDNDQSDEFYHQDE